MPGLHELRPGQKRTARKRVGRGIGSGTGKTSGKGHKGQKARSGGVKGAGFEGGQMPLQRRLPARGFTNPFRVEYEIVNLTDLNRFESGSEVTPELLRETRLVRKAGAPIKVLGRGELDRSLTIRAHRFSRSALEKIEAAGGKAEVI